IKEVFGLLSQSLAISESAAVYLYHILMEGPKRGWHLAWYARYPHANYPDLDTSIKELVRTGLIETRWMGKPPKLWTRVHYSQILIPLLFSHGEHLKGR